MAGWSGGGGWGGAGGMPGMGWTGQGGAGVSSLQNILPILSHGNANTSVGRIGGVGSMGGAGQTGSMAAAPGAAAGQALSMARRGGSSMMGMQDGGTPPQMDPVAAARMRDVVAEQDYLDRRSRMSNPFGEPLSHDVQGMQDFIATTPRPNPEANRLRGALTAMQPFLGTDPTLPSGGWNSPAPGEDPYTMSPEQLDERSHIQQSSGGPFLMALANSVPAGRILKALKMAALHGFGTREGIDDVTGGGTDVMDALSKSQEAGELSEKHGGEHKHKKSKEEHRRGGTPKRKRGGSVAKKALLLAKRNAKSGRKVARGR